MSRKATFPNHRVPREEVIEFYKTCTDPECPCGGMESEEDICVHQQPDTMTKAEWDKTYAE